MTNFNTYRSKDKGDILDELRKVGVMPEKDIEDLSDSDDSSD